MLKVRPIILPFVILFCLYSTRLLAQNFESSSANSAETVPNRPIVSVGGFVNTTAQTGSEDKAFSKNRLPDAQVDTATGITNNSTGSQNHYSNNVNFANDSEIHIKVGGINEFGLKYGAVVELEADVSNDGRGEGFNADKTYVFTESGFGKFEFGNNVASNQKMKVGPATFARAAGGINGKYLEYINLPMLADSTQSDVSKIGDCEGFRVSGSTIAPAGSNCDQIKLPRFILVPQSPISHGGYAKGFYNRASDNSYSNTDQIGFNEGADGSFGSKEDATKISYYTPRISGLQAGVSFTPDTGNSGSSASITGDDTGDVKNAISWGVNYSDNFGNLGVALSATGEKGKYEQIKSSSVNSVIQRNDLNSYDFGIMASYFGFTVGASYGSWGSSLMPKTGIYSCQYDQNIGIADQDCNTATTPGAIVAGQTETVKKFSGAKYWTAGAAYQIGPLALSVTHLNSEFQKNRYSATSAGIDYKMAKGLMPYLEITRFSMNSYQPTYYDGTKVVDQKTTSAKSRQLKDNKGYVALAGLLLSF